MKPLIPFFVCLSIAIPLASSAQSLDEMLAKLPSYQVGQDNAGLVALEQRINRLSGDSAQRAATAAKLAALLASPQTTEAAKLFICQQLRVVGGDAQVPLLASMLPSATTSDMARLCLQAFPGEAATGALIEGLSRCREKQLVGVINSLGARRAAGAVTELRRLLSDPDVLVAGAAARALGAIGTSAAAQALLAAKRAELSSTVWDALLLCAQGLAASGSHAEALRLYDQLVEADAPIARRMSLLAGRVRSDPAGSLSRVVEALGSDEPALQAQGAALSTLVPGEAATRELARLLPGLPPAAQVALLGALADRGDRVAAGAVAELVDSPDPAVKTQALQTLGRIGTVATVEKLLQGGLQGAAADRQAARQALTWLSTPQVDERLVELAQSGQVELRVEAMLALANRGCRQAVPMLLRAAGEPEAKLQIAAFDALAALAGAEEYSDVIDGLLSKSTLPARDSAERAVVAAAQRLTDDTKRMRPLLDRFDQATAPQRCSLLRVMGLLAGPAALNTIVNALKDSDPEVRDAAVRTLADWPDISAADELLKLSLEETSPVHHALALRGFLRLALEAQSGQAVLLAQAVDASKTDADKRALLGALAESGTTGALDAAARLLGDAAVRGEAAVAVLNLAPKVGRRDPLVAEATLKKLIQVGGDNALVTRAQEMLREGWSAAETMDAPYEASVIAERRKQLSAGLLPEDKLVVYLDCGVTARAEGGGGIVVRQLTGKPYTFEGSAGSACARTVAFDGRAVEFVVSGLDTNRAYALGFSWWDGDGGGRSESVQFKTIDGAKPIEALPATRLPAGTARQVPATVQLPVPVAAIAQNRVLVAFGRESGPNAVIGELWLIETKPGSRSATRVVRSGGEAPKPEPVDLTPAKGGTAILIVTGDDYPGHPWQQTAPALKAILDQDPRFQVRIVEDPEALASPQLNRWDAVILHFMDWEKPGPGPAARENLRQFVSGGKGMMLTHFACGAWDGNEWPEFRNLAGRVWDPKLRGHDPHGRFRVEIADPAHPITKGMESFETVDELYTCLAGDAPIHVVAKAKSKVDQKDYPMAFVLSYGQGRVFHCVLGHDAMAYTNSAGVGELMRRGCAWAAGLEPVK